MGGYVIYSTQQFNIGEYGPGEISETAKQFFFTMNNITTIETGFVLKQS